jgi:hypothetical protein
VTNETANEQNIPAELSAAGLIVAASAPFGCVVYMRVGGRRGGDHVDRRGLVLVCATTCLDIVGVSRAGRAQRRWSLDPATRGLTGLQARSQPCIWLAQILRKLPREMVSHRMGNRKKGKKHRTSKDGR